MRRRHALTSFRRTNRKSSKPFFRPVTEALEDRRLLTVFDVTKFDDTADGTCDADCSLREAVIAANANSGDDTINLPAGTYTLTLTGSGEDLAATGDLDVTDAAGMTEIIGDGAGVSVIDGSGLGDQTFHLVAGDSLSLNNLTIDQAAHQSIRTDSGSLSITGAAITNSSAYAVINYSSGDVTIASSVISDNTRGIRVDGGGNVDISNSSIANTNSTGIFNFLGTLRLSNSTITGGSTGIENRSTAVVSRSTISTNRSYGILNNSADLTVVNSTIADNSLSGVVNVGSGNTSLTNSTISGNDYGGIRNRADLTVTNTTISGNTASSFGGLYNSGTAVVRNSTISGNSAQSAGKPGGVYIRAGDVTLQNSIVTGGSGADCSGTFLAASNNLSDGTCDGTIAAVTNVSPVLADNGGPTKTHSLLPGSTAIDAGDAGLLPADDLDLDGDLDTAESLPQDQRGEARIRGGGLDIGAFEAGNVAVTVSETQDPTAAGETFDVTATVAVIAGAGTPTGTVQLTDDQGDFAPIDLTLPPSGVVTFSGVSLSTLGVHDLTVSYSGDGSFDAVQSGQSHKVIVYLDVTKTEDTSDGICNSDCSLREAVVAANAASTEAILRIPAGTYPLTLDGADEDLGETGDLDLNNPDHAISIIGAGDDATIIDASAVSDRVVHIVTGDVHIEGVTITGGSASTGDGGGILASGRLLLNNSVVSDNTAENGGGLHVAKGGGDAIVNNSSITENTASNRGGGIDAIVITVANSTLAGNVGDIGGGIYSRALNLQNSTFSSNSASSHGGAVWVASNSAISNSTFAGNTAPGGANIYNVRGTTTVNNSILADGNCHAAVRRSQIVGSSNLGADSSCAVTGVLTGFDPVLRDNGGATLTHVLFSGSSALDSGDNNLIPSDVTDLDGDGDTSEPLPLDQRGQARIQNGTVDIGAVEGVGDVSLSAVAPSPRTSPVDQLELVFAAAVDEATLTAADISITRDNVSLDSSAVTITHLGGNVYEVGNLTALTTADGVYVVSVTGSGIQQSGGGSFVSSAATSWLTDSVFPALEPKVPLGSLVYDPIVSRAILKGYFQALSVDLEGGQTLSVVVTPDASLRPEVAITSPGGSTIATSSAGAPGESVLFQNLPVITSGNYTITTGGGGTEGDFTLSVTVNASVEAEDYEGVDNDSIATAQNIDGSFGTFGTPSASRGAVSGRVTGSSVYVVGTRLGTLYTLDPATSSVVSSTTLSLNGKSTGGGRGLAIDPTTGMMWILFDAGLKGTSGLLGTVDPSTGAVTSVGQLDTVDDRFGEIAFDLNGNLYAVTGGSDSNATPNTLFSIDKSNATKIAALHTFTSEGAGGVTLNPDDGLLYRYHNGDFASIDVGNDPPTVTSISVSGDIAGKGTGMSYIGRGKFLVVGSPLKAGTPFYEVDTSGNSTLLGYGTDFVKNALHGAAAILGNSVDVFEFNLPAEEFVSLALGGGDATVELLDGNGRTLATGTATGNASSAIPATLRHTGTYYARVSSSVDAEYTLVVTRGIDFELESNDTSKFAQHLSDAGGVLGYLGGSSVLYGADNGDGNFLIVDPVTGNSTVLSSHVGQGHGYTDLAYNPITKIMYASQAEGGTGLFSVDLATGAETLLGSPGKGLHALAWSPDGSTLYGMLGKQFGTLDPKDGKFTTISDPGLGNLGGLAFHPTTGELYGVTNSAKIGGSLYTLDTDSGVATLVVSLDRPLNSLEFRADGTLLGGGKSGDGGLYEISLNTGTTTLIGQMAAGKNRNATGLEFVAQPREDHYAISVTAGQQIDLSTLTPGDGAGQFHNDFDPVVELYDPKGALVASDDNGAADGRNARLSHVAAANGNYLARVTGATVDSGEYMLFLSVPDLPPSVDAGQSLTISEDAAVGTAAGIATATDPEGDPRMNWQIVGGSGQGVFDIDAATGEITSLAALDFETTSSYLLEVTVDDDQGNRSLGELITIQVADVNEDGDPVFVDGNGDLNVIGNGNGNRIIVSPGSKGTVSVSIDNVSYKGFSTPTRHVIITAGDGDNDIVISGGFSPVMTSDISAGNGRNYIAGGGGRDNVSAGEGKNVILTGRGDDMVTVTGAGDSDIDSGAGDDTITTGDGNDEIVAGDGDDVVYAGGGRDVVAGGLGDDILFGQAGDDVLSGGDGDDIVVGDAGNDELFGREGNDIVVGSDGSDGALGNGGDDLLVGGRTTQVLSSLRDARTAWVASPVSIPTQLLPVTDDGSRDALVGAEGDDFRIGEADVDFFDRVTGNDNSLFL